MSDSDLGRRSTVAGAREVLLIVLGVLIALGLESAWQARLDRAAERELLAGLLAELEENLGSIDESLGVHTHIAESADSVLASFERVEKGGSVLIADSILSQLTRGPTYVTVRASLDAALNSGRVELIRSPDVQRSLARWSQAAAEAFEEETDGRDFVSTQLLPVLRRASDLSTVYRTYVAAPGASERGRLPWGGSESSMLVSRELTNLVWRRRFYAATAMNQLGALRAQVVTTIELVSEALS